MELVPDKFSKKIEYLNRCIISSNKTNVLWPPTFPCRGIWYGIENAEIRNVKNKKADDILSSINV